MDMVKFAQPQPASSATGAPLIDKLLEAGYPHLAAEEIDLFIASAGLKVVFVTGDPVRLLDSTDLAIVLPELARHFEGKLEGAVCQRGAEPAMAQRFGADVRPALVFFAAGEHLGTIPRVRDWDEYVTKVSEFIRRAAEQPAPTCQ